MHRLPPDLETPDSLTVGYCGLASSEFRRTRTDASSELQSDVIASSQQIRNTDIYIPYTLYGRDFCCQFQFEVNRFITGIPEIPENFGYPTRVLLNIRKPGLALLVPFPSFPQLHDIDYNKSMFIRPDYNVNFNTLGMIYNFLSVCNSLIE